MPESADELVLVGLIDFQGVVDNMLRPGRQHYIDTAVKRVETGVARLFDELRADMRSGDELWWCRSAVFDPHSLIGDEGVAIVRGRHIVRYQRLLSY